MTKPLDEELRNVHAYLLNKKYCFNVKHFLFFIVKAIISGKPCRCKTQPIEQNFEFQTSKVDWWIICLIKIIIHIYLNISI